MDMLQQLGAAALGSRFRRLAERLSADASTLYRSYSVPLEPGWFPVFHLLSLRDSATITEIAEQIGHSHPFVSKTVRQMKERGYLVSVRDEADRRVTAVSLSAEGRALVPKLAQQIGDVDSAMQALLDEISPAFLQALDKLEDALKQQPLPGRVKAVRRRRAATEISIIDYDASHAADFYSLNKRWIERYWTLEEADYKALRNPQRIIDDGGLVLLARTAEGRICGTCALIRLSEQEYELAKMTVADSERGCGIGEILGLAAIERARGLGAKRLYLESNSALQPALNLYRKLGFSEVEGRQSPYQRCDIQMALELQS